MSFCAQRLEQYDRDGILFPIPVFSAAEVCLFRDALQSIADHNGAGSLRRFDNLHQFFEWAHRLVTHGALLDAVEDILGSDILIDGTLVFFKPPQDSSYVSWHQDSVYSGWHLTPSTSAWIAITASNRANGCLRVLPGSHKQGLLDHDNVRDDPDLLNRRGERIKMVVDESQTKDVVLQPGEISLHHSTIIHGSNPNTSDEPRIGFIVRYVTNQIRNRETPLLRVRGNADCSHLTLAQPPLETDLKSAFAAWKNFSSDKGNASTEN